MDHRENEPAPSRRFARLVPPAAVRKLDVARLSTAVGAGLFALVVLGYGAWYVVTRATDWLARQGTYRIAFREIVLNPPPPAWYRGGAPAFLDRVRARAAESESIGILDADLGRIETAFKHCPWVRNVSRVRRVYPPQIVVNLEYYTPVAGKGEWLIDRDGHVLPAEDVDRRALDVLLVEYLGPPYDPKAGRWHLYDEGRQGARDELRAKAAGRLAAFLLSPDARRESGLPPSVRAILVGDDERQLFVQFEPVTRVKWGSAPGNEAPDEPSAREKWQIVRNWFRDHPEPIARGDFLVISGGALVIQHETSPAPRGPLSRRAGGSRDSMSR